MSGLTRPTTTSSAMPGAGEPKRFNVRVIDEFGTRISRQVEVSGPKRKLVWYAADGSPLAGATSTDLESITLMTVYMKDRKSSTGSKTLSLKRDGVRDELLLSLETKISGPMTLQFDNLLERELFSGSILLHSSGSIVSQVIKKSSKSCSVCKKPFSLTRFKHKCKHCDNAVCHKCLEHKVRLGTTTDTVKVCGPCFESIKRKRVDDNFKDLHYADVAGGSDSDPKTPKTGSSERLVESGPSLSSDSSKLSDAGVVFGTRTTSDASVVSSAPSGPKTDLYGFVLGDAEAAEARRTHQAEWADKRTAVWDKYLMEHPRLEDAEGLKTMVRAGIPPRLRGHVWKTLSRSNEYKSIYPPDYYQQLCAKAKELAESDMNVKQIEKDLKRTFPRHAFFDQAGGLQPLRRILSAYSLRNPVVGYCQSMNFIVGVLMLFLDEEDAFWMLCSVVERITCVAGLNPLEHLDEPGLLPSLIYYQKDLGGLQVDQKVFQELVRQRLSKVSKKFAQLDIDLAPLTMQWFLCLFVNTLPLEVTLRIWDSMFLEGSKVLFRAALTMLKLNKKMIVSCDGFESLHTGLMEFEQSDIDADSFMHQCFDSSWLGSFSSKTILKLRNAYKAEVESTFGIRPLALKKTLAEVHEKIFGEVLPDFTFKYEHVHVSRTSRLSQKISFTRLAPKTVKEVTDMLGEVKLEAVADRVLSKRESSESEIVRGVGLTHKDSSGLGTKTTSDIKIVDSGVSTISSDESSPPISEELTLTVKLETSLKGLPECHFTVKRKDTLLDLRAAHGAEISETLMLEHFSFILESGESVSRDLEDQLLASTFKGYILVRPSEVFDDESSKVERKFSLSADEASEIRSIASSPKTPGDDDVPDIIKPLPKSKGPQKPLPIIDDKKTSSFLPGSYEEEKDDIDDFKTFDPLLYKAASLAGAESILKKSKSATKIPTEASESTSYDPKFHDRMRTLSLHLDRTLVISSAICAALSNCKQIDADATADERDLGQIVKKEDKKMIAFGKTWHAECFVCALCGESLIGKKYHLYGDELLCDREYLQRNAEGVLAVLSKTTSSSVEPSRTV